MLQYNEDVILEFNILTVKLFRSLTYFYYNLTWNC